MLDPDETSIARPPSLLEHRRRGVREIAGGLCVAVFAHVGLPLIGSLIVAVGTAIGVLGGDTKAEAAPPKEIVEARFVKLGKVFDPRELPNRVVPRKSTAPSSDTVVSKNAQRRPRPDAGVLPPDAVEDLLARIGDRAHAFSEIAEEREREGSPDGIEEGTATTSTAGDLYAGRLYAFFRRSWTVPNTLDAERASLVTEVDVPIGADLRLGAARVRRSSGNAVFDQSVIDALEALRGADATVPPPPEEVASTYLGQTVGLRFRGRDASAAP